MPNSWYEFESEQDRLSEDRDKLYLENEPIDAHHDDPDLCEHAD